MTRTVAHYMPREMALLGATEMLVSVAVITAVLVAGHIGIDFTGAPSTSWADALRPAFVLSVTLGGAAAGSGLYCPAVYRDRRRLISGGVATLASAATLLIFGSSALSLFDPAHIGTGIALLLAGGAGACSVRLAHALLIGRRPLTRRVLLAGSADDVRALQTFAAAWAGSGLEPVMLPVEEWSWDTLRQRRVWAVVAGTDVIAKAPPGLLDCKLRGMRVLSSAQFREKYFGRIEPDSLSQVDLLTTSGFISGRLQNLVKRVFDLLLGSLMLVATLPLMAVISVAIKLDSPGPVLYTQQRVGRFGIPFTLLKFRSMATNAETGGQPRWAQKCDPRVTRVGRFIRTTRIDELPQLINVLRGEMSLVGPRPERPHFVEQLARAIPFYDQRSYVKPGLTGWAQVSFPYGASVEDAREKLSYDLYYVKNKTLILDLVILFATIRVVLRGEGAR